jgi:hypothetical protein
MPLCDAGSIHEIIPRIQQRRELRIQSSPPGGRIALCQYGGSHDPHLPHQESANPCRTWHLADAGVPPRQTDRLVKRAVADAATYPLTLQGFGRTVRMIGLGDRHLQERQQVLDPVVRDQRVVELGGQAEFGFTNLRTDKAMRVRIAWPCPRETKLR